MHVMGALKNDTCDVTETVVNAMLGLLIVILVITIVVLSFVLARRTALWFVHF